MFLTPIRPFPTPKSIHFSASHGQYPNYQDDDEESTQVPSINYNYSPPQDIFGFSPIPAIPAHMRTVTTPSPHYMSGSPFHLPHFILPHSSHVSPLLLAQPASNSPSPRRSLDAGPADTSLLSGRFWGPGSSSEDGTESLGPRSLRSNNSDMNHVGPNQFSFQPIEEPPRVTESERMAAAAWERCQELDETSGNNFFTTSYIRATEGAESVKTHNTATNITPESVNGLANAYVTARQYNITLNPHTGARLLPDHTGSLVANALDEFFGNQANSATTIVQDTNVHNDDHLFNFKTNGSWNDKVKTMNADMNRIYLTRQVDMGGQPKLLVIVLNKEKNGALTMLSVVPHSNMAINTTRYSPLRYTNNHGSFDIRNLSTLASLYPKKVDKLGIAANDDEEDYENEEYDDNNDELVTEYD